MVTIDISPGFLMVSGHCLNCLAFFFVGNVRNNEYVGYFQALDDHFLGGSSVSSHVDCFKVIGKLLP